MGVDEFAPISEPEPREPDMDSIADGVLEELGDEEFETTFGELCRAFDSDESAQAVAVSGSAAAMVRLAVDQRRQGVAEKPPGSNAGPPLERYTRWFIPASGPQPWCAFFVSWCLDRATDSNHRVPWTYPGSVASIYGWAKGGGRLVAKPLHGDIFGIGSEHTGIVAGAAADGDSIWTVEGNYSSSVASVSRRSSGLWFARI